MGESAKEEMEGTTMGKTIKGVVVNKISPILAELRIP